MKWMCLMTVNNTNIKVPTLRCLLNPPIHVKLNPHHLPVPTTFLQPYHHSYHCSPVLASYQPLNSLIQKHTNKLKHNNCKDSSRHKMLCKPLGAAEDQLLQNYRRTYWQHWLLIWPKLKSLADRIHPGGKETGWKWILSKLPTPHYSWSHAAFAME